jgi:hypothetical protein
MARSQDDHINGFSVPNQIYGLNWFDRAIARVT